MSRPRLSILSCILHLTGTSWGLLISNKIIPEGIIIPGVGCVNGCRFCSTSHFFQKQYIPFIKTGKEFFNLCRQYEEKMGITDFFVLDENFFKSKERARELLHLMEKHGKPYCFNIFSSAETIMTMGIDFIQRIGIDFLWIGVESLKEVYEKNRGIDFHQLVRDLRNQGVSILTSGILFLEHHTKETIHEDIDFLVGLKPDLIQFMALGLMPGTSVYKDYQQKNKIMGHIPYEEQHGQKGIWFKHPDFTPGESDIYLKNAFKKDFQENGPSILRMADTYLRGAIATDNGSANDEFMKLRRQQRRKNALDFYPALDALVTHAPNPSTKEYAKTVRQQYNEYFGKRPLKVMLFSAAVQAMILKEKIRSRLIYNNMRQPKTLYITYRIGKLKN